jgi:hypothetical protein
VGEDIIAAHLVVQEVEAVRRLVLRLDVQRPLKPPNTVRSLQAHANLRILGFVVRTQKRGRFPPPALPAFIGTISLSDAHGGRQPMLPSSVATARRTWASHVAQRTMRPCRSPYPGGLRRVRLSIASAADASLPRYSDGSASTSSLSRPAQDSLALRPVRLLISPVGRHCPRSFGSRPAGSYRVEPTLTRVAFPSTRPPRLRAALNNAG